MCHKRVFKAKVVWRGRSQLRRYSRPRDLCRRVYLSSSHRSPLEEAFLLHRARGCELVIHGYIVFVFMILYLWFWICISKVLYFWMFVFVFVFCATQGMLKVASSWSMDPSQSTMAHSDKTALFTFSQSSYLPTYPPILVFASGSKGSVHWTHQLWSFCCVMSFSWTIDNILYLYCWHKRKYY